MQVQLVLNVLYCMFLLTKGHVGTIRCNVLLWLVSVPLLTPAYHHVETPSEASEASRVRHYNLRNLNALPVHTLRQVDF